MEGGVGKAPKPLLTRVLRVKGAVKSRLFPVITLLAGKGWDANAR
jgi:hypothetical protein